MTERKIHPLMAAHEITIVPGVYVVLSARMARSVGFRGAVLTGYGVAASYLGEPDFGLLTPDRDPGHRPPHPASGRHPPDRGRRHGLRGPAPCAEDGAELVAMGAFGILLENQTWPKRCGHMRGKDVTEAK